MLGAPGHGLAPPHPALLVHQHRQRRLLRLASSVQRPERNFMKPCIFPSTRQKALSAH